ncbi:MOSC domain-containing protein [Nostocoides sp. F2B08]|uniref:MOSC domain-containing protein n=1 Tax=Nostocoides sp. F2B08 TaxID=2653936 RepID=UPI001263A831|nr:MOSC domain-containing protein [Tetrasphaera sp. F2B08]KAB7742469.1 MOSC domain-containing protein [Tetrasphaera sp. F2B08]
MASDIVAVTAASVWSVNSGEAGAPSGRGSYLTGIEKRPREAILITAPLGGGGRSGVAGDHVGNRRHHGGPDKAVYAYSREELTWWEAELGREFPSGFFGENLTTSGVDLELLLINQRVRIGADVVLEVSLPRQPCATFQAHLGERGWVRRFTERGRCGAYFRVISQGTVRPHDVITPLNAPDHGVDLRVAFAAVMGDDSAAATVVETGCLPEVYHRKLAQRRSRVTPARGR